jgi:N-acetylneuraminate synthase
MAQKFGCKVGISDHTMGFAVPVAAVALGAQVIEKHFTLARADGGADCGFSLEPDEFKAMVDNVRIAEKALGDIRYGGSAGDEKSKVFRRSLFVVKDIKKDEVFTLENVRSIRPGYGLMPRELDNIIGKTAARDIARGSPLASDHVEQ